MESDHAAAVKLAKRLVHIPVVGPAGKTVRYSRDGMVRDRDTLEALDGSRQFFPSATCRSSAARSPLITTVPESMSC